MDKKFEANKEFMGNVSLQCIKCIVNKNKQANKSHQDFAVGFTRAALEKC